MWRFLASTGVPVVTVSPPLRMSSCIPRVYIARSPHLFFFVSFIVETADAEHWKLEGLGNSNVLNKYMNQPKNGCLSTICMEIRTPCLDLSD